MTDLVGATLIPIDKKGKYFLKIPASLGLERQRKLRDMLCEWLDGPDPIAIITDQWEIIEIGRGGEDVAVLPECGT